MGFILVVFLMGVLIQSVGITLFDKIEKSLANVFIVGFLFTISVSQLILIPMVLYWFGAVEATYVWWAVFIVLSIISLIKCRKDIAVIVSTIPSKIKTFFIEKKCGGVYGTLAVILIAFQLCASIFLYHYDDDDAFYVTSVASNITDNSFWQTYGPTGEEIGLPQMTEYITTGWYDLLTVICQSTRLPAAVLMHTVLPVLMIALAYTSTIVFARILIKKESQRHLFITFVCIINILNNVSTHTSSSVLLMRMHQGKALFANIIVPVMFCIFLLMWDQKEDKKHIVLLLMANISACAFSTTGVVFSAMLTVIFASVFAIYNRSVKRGLFVLLTIIPNIVFAAIYIIERWFEVWGC